MQFNSESIAEVKRVLSTIAEPSQEIFNHLARSQSFEIRALLYEKIVDKRPPFVHLNESEVDGFCIDFLLDSFKNNSRSPDDIMGIEYSRGEAAMDLVVWFKTFLREGKEDQLLKMRDELAQLWRHGDANSREVILTHIFEHILDIDELRAVFEPWSTDSELATAYFKGVEYAIAYAGNARGRTK
jgi:hypothetical protein